MEPEIVKVFAEVRTEIDHSRYFCPPCLSRSLRMMYHSPILVHTLTEYDAEEDCCNAEHTQAGGQMATDCQLSAVFHVTPLSTMKPGGW